MNPFDYEAPLPNAAAHAAPQKGGLMSTRTLFILNGGLLLFFGALFLELNNGVFWAFGFWAGYFLRSAIAANGLLLFKALWRREYSLALQYGVVVVGAVAFLVFASGIR